MERIELEMLIEKNQLTDKEAWELSEEVKKNWWKKNKDRVLGVMEQAADEYQILN